MKKVPCRATYLSDSCAFCKFKEQCRLWINKKKEGMKNPTRTIHCSICGKAISGYDLAERMAKLRHHYKLSHPRKFGQWTVKSLATKRAKGIIKNPYPLLISTINPAGKSIVTKFAEQFGVHQQINQAIKRAREMYGPKAALKFRIISRPEIKDGAVGVSRGRLTALEYKFASIKDSVKPRGIYRHDEGDTGNDRLKAAKNVVVEIPHGKTMMVLYSRNSVNAEGYKNT